MPGLIRAKMDARLAISGYDPLSRGLEN